MNRTPTTQCADDPPRAAVLAAAALVRFITVLLAWGALSGGAGFMPWGILAALLLTWRSLRALPPRRGALRAGLKLIQLMPIIVRESLLGGWDVARRALSLNPELRPRFEVVRLEPTGRPVAITLAYAITLMPGTLAVEVENQRLLVHLIDYRRDDCRAIKEFEQRLFRLVGERP
jgi:multicomponent Na+:H+ antiporter subunit E